MTLSFYEPPPLEIRLTLGLGLTLLSPYYSRFAHSLNLNGDERVLDFGSGSGVCARHIAARLQNGGGLDCVDISRGWMQVIRRTLRRYENIAYHLGRVARLDLPRASYDLIVVHFVLHDIPAAERAAIVKTLAGLLKPDGRLVLREPQGHGLSLEAIRELTRAAGLRAISLKPRKFVIGGVYDASFTPA